MQREARNLILLVCQQYLNKSQEVSLNGLMQHKVTSNISSSLYLSSEAFYKRAQWTTQSSRQRLFIKYTNRYTDSWKQHSPLSELTVEVSTRLALLCVDGAHKYVHTVVTWHFWLLNLTLLPSSCDCSMPIQHLFSTCLVIIQCSLASIP